MKFLSLFIVTLLLSSCSQIWNNPHDFDSLNAQVLHLPFSSPPKHLDPVVSYNANEAAFIAQVYEPLLQYHYFKQPYQIEPLTLAKMPVVSYLDSEQQVTEDVATYTKYHFTIKDDIYYQPHPAFAQQRDGGFKFHQLTPKMLKGIKSPFDFKTKATKKLTVDDYIYAIKRMAIKSNNSPVLATLKPVIIGLEDYSNSVSKGFDLKEDYRLSKLDIAGVSKISDTEFTILIKGVYPQFLYWLTMNFFAPIPWEAIAFYDQEILKEHNISLDTYPVGTGPYQLVENQPNQRIRLITNPNYKHGYYPHDGLPEGADKSLLDDANKPLPFIKEAVYSLEKESIPAWNKFLQGFYDASGVSSSSFDQAMSINAGELGITDEMKKKGISFSTVVEPSISYWAFNMADKTVGGYSEKQQKLRQAISIAFNEEEYISIFFNGRGVPAQGPIPNGIFGSLDGEKGINPYVYDWKNNHPVRKPIEFAKQLLAEAGYKNGKDKNGKQLVLNFDTSLTGPDGKALLDWNRKQLKKLNIELIIRSSDYNRFQDKVRTAQVQLFTWGWNADYPDPENFLFLLAGENAPINTDGYGVNGANYDNPKYNAMFKKVKTMQNTEERQALINQMVELVRKDAPWSFGHHKKNLVLKHNWYKNSWINPLAQNTLKYKRIDAEKRMASIEKWNQPVIWPIWFVLFVLLGSIYPLAKAYRAKQKQVIS